MEAIQILALVGLGALGLAALAALFLLPKIHRHAGKALLVLVVFVALGTVWVQGSKILG